MASINGYFVSMFLNRYLLNRNCYLLFILVMMRMTGNSDCYVLVLVLHPLLPQSYFDAFETLCAVVIR